MENFSQSDNESEYDFEFRRRMSGLDRKIALGAFLVVLALFLAYLFFFSPPGDFPVGEFVSVQEGAGLRSVSQSLEESGIIRSRAVFETLVITLGSDRRVIAGDYFFERKITVFEVARRLAKGEQNLLPVRVTIPEGFTALDIATLLAEKLSKFNKENFLKEAREGYLFPDTYFFTVRDSETDVLRSIQRNYEKKISLVREDIKKSGRTEGEIITMASLIEKEANGDGDREIISGILWKRLGKGMPLQVDAEPKTYESKGLPKTPIANPGMDSIKAAIYPKSSAYLYYLHDKDGKVHYASTLAEHNANIRKYLK